MWEEGATGDQKRVLSPLKLEWQAAVCHPDMGAGSRILSFPKQKVLFFIMLFLVHLLSHSKFH